MVADSVYHPILIDHFKHPRHKQTLDNFNGTGKAINANCGDVIALQIEQTEQTIKNIGYQIRGCAVCTASASLMADYMLNKDKPHFEITFNAIQRAITGQEAWPDSFVALSGVASSIGRHKCILLPWQALNQAFEHK